MKFWLSCNDFILAGLPNDCCTSCHEDVEYGYEMLYLEPGGRSNTEAYICCGMSRIIEESNIPLRSLFAQTLLARRKRINEMP